MLVQKIMKHWENIANFLFTPISTVLRSLCGSMLPPAKAYALTTFVYRLRNSSPAANRARYADQIRDLSPCKGRLRGSTHNLWAPCFLFQCLWLHWAAAACSQLTPVRVHWGSGYLQGTESYRVQSPRSLQSIENNWDNAKGCMAEAVEPFAVLNTAEHPWGHFLCPPYSISLGTVPVVYGWDSGKHWSWCTSAHGEDFGKITQLCDINHGTSLIQSP